MVFTVNFAKYLKASFLRSTSVWRVLFYNSYWLYTLQLYIAGNFQVVKSHSSGKKIIHIFKDFTNLDFFCTDFFSFSATQNVWCALSSRLGSETTKHNAFDEF